MKKLSEQTLANKLGNYTCPQGYYQRTKEMPFLGKVTCHTEKLVAGSWQEIILDYEVGAAGLADGAWIKATFKFYSDWALFQTTDPKAANYVSAEYQAAPCLKGQSPATVQALKVRFDQKGHERPFQKAIIVDTVDGYLKPGDHIIIRLGDKRAGGPGTRVQTFVEQDFRFRCYIDPLGTSRFAAIPNDVIMDIIAGTPEKIEIAGPRLIKNDAKANLRIRLEDAWGNTCWDTSTKVHIQARLNNKLVYEKNLYTEEQGWATCLCNDLPTHENGELEITFSAPDYASIKPANYYLTITDNLDAPRLFYGDLHVHSDDTVGTNNTVYNLSYGRDVAGLDVLGYTANDFQITKERWQQAVETIETLNKNGEFVCFPGTEWCGNSCAGGDHNVIFLHDDKPEFPFDNAGNVVRSFEWNEDMQSDTIMPGTWPLDELYAAYIHDPEGHLLMPHVGGRRCNLDWHHPVLERLVEIGSAWGQFPWIYQETMARGYKLGASANGDEHRGRCGGGVPGTAVFGVKGGLTGIIADRLDRHSVGQALRARHTWATTGERTVALANCGLHIQGDELTATGDININYRFLGDCGWDEICAFDHNGIFWRRSLVEEAGYSKRLIRVRWGGARIKDRYRWASWCGKINIINGTIHRFNAMGFEHKEESCWRDKANSIGFSSDTYGDSDLIEIELSNLDKCKIEITGTIDGYIKVGDPLSGNPFMHCPEFSWQISGEDLLQQSKLRQELGGADLFLEVEQFTQAELPRDVAGSITVQAENGPHGFRPVYFAGRQRDGSMAWTSAMFIEFK